MGTKTGVSTAKSASANGAARKAPTKEQVDAAIRSGDSARAAGRSKTFASGEDFLREVLEVKRK